MGITRKEMMVLEYEIIKTGSKGNSILFNKTLLLDIGIPYKDIKKYLKEVKTIFISHLHADHLNKTTAKLISYNYPKIKFLCNFEVAVALFESGVKKYSIWCLDEHRWFDLGFAKVRIEKLIHDVNNSSFQIEYKNGKKMIYITDTGSIPSTINAKDYDNYLIEANYKNEEELGKLIQQDYDNGKEFSHYVRVRDTHLSEEQALEWLKENMGENSKFEFIHMHKGENNARM